MTGPCMIGDRDVHECIETCQVPPAMHCAGQFDDRKWCADLGVNISIWSDKERLQRNEIES